MSNGFNAVTNEHKLSKNVKCKRLVKIQNN